MIDPTYLISCGPKRAEPATRLISSLVVAGVHWKFRTFQGNSFDMNAIIAVLEGKIDVGSHVVLLHDTMEVTRDTPRLVELADPNSGAVAAFGGQCNLGLYRMDYLMACRDLILAQKNCSKKQSIDFEGSLWGECPSRTTFPNSNLIEGEITRPYGCSLRKREFYEALAIVKWKANWGQTDETNYILDP
jgi:hypothetical protein